MSLLDKRTASDAVKCRGQVRKVVTSENALA